MNSLHQFHIPVMGLAYTIDSPVKVARYGIASTISIVEDKLVELMRLHYYRERKDTYTPITPREDDYRAKRITDYLNLVNKMVQEQIEQLKASAFETGSEISKYFEMLPTSSSVRQLYQQIIQAGGEVKTLQDFLRSQIVPGAIDVNIMTKLDKDNSNKEGEVIAETSDALAALRGYAKSDLTNSSIIFSAGLNPRLFNYLEKLPAFNATGFGKFDKRIVIKVSDYRSAIIQGKYLAKKGLWVSEFRIESGLNCGGHAFASDGFLLGPILEEFKTKKEELIQTLFQLYNPAVQTKGGETFDQPHPINITVQGGIGTAEEADFLIEHYGVTSAGWGTPFLLCPEATTVDNVTLNQLSLAKEEDVILSKFSPLGVRFNYLKGSSAEKEKQRRIDKGSPGSPCTEKHLVSNTEFTKEPICTASHKYQKLKINQLKEQNLPEAEYIARYNEVVGKECLCVGLSNSASMKYGVPFIKNRTDVNICPGPNIAYFHKIVSLKEMTDHIYGRTNILSTTKRPHMFIKELDLNIDYVKEQISNLNKMDGKQTKDATKYIVNLIEGIEYYKVLSLSMFKENISEPFTFLNTILERENDLKKLQSKLV
ncbi:MAG TPA: hypothetical protein PLJ60_16305 [Chryseolinea sp.]|nr:hypothetical protein [Chryseolinea sp.]HPM31899.1 hypothetical protein [Chryseolinea sp.]